MNCKNCRSAACGGRPICLYCGGNAVGATAGYIGGGTEAEAAHSEPVPQQQSTWDDIVEGKQTGQGSVARPGKMIIVFEVIALIFALYVTSPAFFYDSNFQRPLLFLYKMPSYLFIAIGWIIMSLPAFLGVRSIIIGSRGKSNNQTASKKTLIRGIVVTVIAIALLCIWFSLSNNSDRISWFIHWFTLYN